MKRKFGYSKKIRLAVIAFLLILPIQSANAQMIHSDNDNDNFRYFYDIAVDVGSYMPMNATAMSSFSDGSVISLSGSYYYNDKFGFRSGISYISGLYGCDKYLKVPFLFSFRTRTFHWLIDRESDNLRELLLDLLLLLLPTRFELNVGPSLGYINPSKYAYYTNIRGNDVLVQTADIRSRFASSIDANARVTFQFWRICINGNIGFNYLLTNNFDYRIYSPNTEKVNASWFLNASAGLSFRF
jgi:hypothetical protein